MLSGVIDRVATVQTYYDGDDGPMREARADDFTLHIPAIGFELNGRDAIEQLRPRSEEVRDNQTEELVDVVEHGPFVIARYTTTAKDTGVTLACVDFYRWDGDLLVEQWVHTPPLDYPVPSGTS
jgi:predicted SnoaL-like aldol condensation-catalyzing enzyme